MSRPVLTFITDFGLSDGFVGTMKGVALAICPDLTIVDITHQVPPQDIRTGELILRAAHPYFPQGTIHVAVVDPGVGSGRRAILIQDEKFLFLGPDNGVLTSALEKEGAKVREVCNPRWFLKGPSATFHGRDVFAPAAAHLGAGAEPTDAGPEVSDAIRLPFPSPRVEADRKGARARIRGVVIHVDRFGNLITNVDRESFEEASGSARGGRARVFLKGREVAELVRFYNESREGKAAALFNSWGFLELFVSCGNAAQILNAGLDETVIVEISA
ncbi:MAG: S-adenosyl-l-methionine hydroxide adenosyltransferase family protein [Nitrospinota bacterium]